ncbi:MAG: type I secretion system permease/ATPase [Pseudomonadota bacterium]
MGVVQNTAEMTKSDAVSTSGPRCYFEIVEWLAGHFSQPFQKSAVEQSLPANFEQLDWRIIARALPVVGLKSQVVTRSLKEISPLVLPCVVSDKTGNPFILSKLADQDGNCEIFTFADGSKSQKISDKALRKKLGPELMLVTIDADTLASRTDKDANYGDGKHNRWFWKPVRQHWSAWLQIIVAAFGINILGLALPIFVMNVYDRVIPNLAIVTLWTLAIGVALALALDLLLKLIRTNVLERAGRRIDLIIASELFRHAMAVRLLDRRGGAATVASQIRDFESVRDFFTSNSFVAVIDLMFIGIFVAVLWMIVGPIAIVPLLAVPIVIVVALVAQVPIGASIERVQQLSGKKQLVLVESLLGIETVKSLNGERVMQREWENAVAASSQITGKTKFWSNFAISSTMLIQQSVSVIIIVWGVYLVSNGEITVGGLIAANILAGRVLAPLGNISQTLVRAQQAIRSLSVISEYMQLPSERSEIIGSELTVQDGSVQLINTGLTYPGSQVPALSDFSINVKPGDSVGILGRVGSGKTTLGKVFSGLVQPDSGLVLVDGHEIGQYESASLRDGIGYLPQDPEMFTGTILENLLIGKPNATETEINEALYYSGMDYFVSENPEGLKQFVGEKGNRLSGGQRQSVSLARLILRQPKLLYLDEPTNAMDHTTEHLVINRLKELNAKGVTLVVSTHRHSLTAILDRLVVIDNGKKVIEGSREEVLKYLSNPQKSG